MRKRRRLGLCMCAYYAVRYGYGARYGIGGCSVRALLAVARCAFDAMAALFAAGTVSHADLISGACAAPASFVWTKVLRTTTFHTCRIICASQSTTVGQHKVFDQSFKNSNYTSLVIILGTFSTTLFTT